MNVPLLDLQPQMNRFRDEIIQEITGVIDSTRYILGPKVTRLEQEIADYCGTAEAVGVSSGTDALLVTLMALDIGKGDLVLTTPFTFFATMGSIIRCGAMPVFADVEEQSLNIDAAHISEILKKDSKNGSKIKAIMPVHLYGQCADMPKINALAKEYGIAVIEDAAQAIGAECPFIADDGRVEWKRAGSMGVGGCFSFFPSKNLGCIGDGGVVTTQNKDFAARLESFRNHGAEPKYFHSHIGGNFRLDPIQACVLSIKLPHLDSWHEQRRQNAMYYKTLFERHDLVENPVCLPTAVYENVDGADDHDYHIYNQFVIQVPQRDKLLAYLHEHDIGCEIYYPLCLHQQKCLEKYGFDKLSFPVAEHAAKKCLALPIYPELNREQQEYVVETVSRFYLT